MSDQPRYDTAAVKAALANRMLDVCLHLFPSGRKSGRNFLVGDIEGNPGKSFSIILEGEKAGTWRDFADNDKAKGPLDLWMQRRNLAFPEALREAAQWAGIAPTANGTHAAPRRATAANGAQAANGTHAPAPADWSEQWAACVARATDERLAPIAAERGLSMAFLRYAAERGWIGFHGEAVAFPVINDAGVTVACHYRLPDRSWRYEPKGCGTHPLVIGDPAKTGIAWAFESQWDAFLVLDGMGVHDDADSFTDFFAVTVTRGAGNGALATRAAAGCKTLVAWPQNDPPHPKTGKVPSEDWMQAIVAAAPAGMTVRRVQTPQEHEDAAAWCKAAHPSREDFLAAVAEAAQIEAPAPEEAAQKAARVAVVMEKLRAVAFDVDNAPPDEPVIMSVAGVEACHAGNITVIEAHIKTGKSALVAAGIASILGEADRDYLGWSSDGNARCRGVIHFDSEQSRGGADKLMRRALSCAGIPRPPEWFASYGFTGWSISLMREAVECAMIDSRERFGGVHSVWIDGLADLVQSPNDEQECFAFVRWLQEKAIEFHCPIIGILHLNPGDTGKSRGHLGSELNRKAETMLRVTKDADEVSAVTTPHGCRNAPIPPKDAPRFAWSGELHRHVSVQTTATTKTNAKRERLADLAAEIFRDVPEAVGLTWEQLHVVIETKEGIGRSGARKRFDALMAMKVIRKNGEKYRLA